MKRKLLMISWRDIRSPFAGGAEILTHNILRRLTKTYDITVLSSAFPGCKKTQKIDRVTYIRLGSAKKNYIGPYNWRIYFSVFRYWYTHIKEKQRFDVVIEQINNVPFFYSLYGDPRTILFFHQLCRKNWFYQTPFLVALVGYFFFEPIYLWLLRSSKVMTVSQSTKEDLSRYGFSKDRIHIISEGSTIAPAAHTGHIRKRTIFTVLSLGNIRPMKRTHLQIRAFEEAKKKYKKMKLLIAGDAGGVYGGKVLQQINESPFRDDITYLGKLTEKEKCKLMRSCHVILGTSEREGWGLVITEAGSQGTPAVVYDVPGLRDSVIDGKTGYVCKVCTPEAMGQILVKLAKHPAFYKTLVAQALERNKLITFDKSAQDAGDMFEKEVIERYSLSSRLSYLEKTLFAQ